MTSLVANGWLAVTLDSRAAEIDPRGEFADGLTRAGGGRWYSKAPPLAPLAASVPYALLGTLGAYALPAASVIAAFFLATRIGRGLSGAGSGGSAGSRGSLPAAGAAAARHDPGSRAFTMSAAIGAVAATPLVVHGALFCGHAVAAALTLGAAARFMEACSRGFPSSPESRRPLAGAGLCAALAALARPEAVWFVPACLAAWAILREGRPRIAVIEGARWRVAFLALASALHVAIGLLVTGMTSGGGGASPRVDEWGAPLLLPVVAPAALALFGLLAAAARRAPSPAPGAPPEGGGLAGAGTRPRGGAIMAAIAPWARWIWIGLVAAGLVAQSAGILSTLSARAASARVIAAIEETALPGEAVVSDSARIPGLAATLAPTRAILLLRPGGAPEDLLAALGGSNVRALAAVSRAAVAEDGGEPLAARRAIGAYLREGEPRRIGGWLIARFVGAGPDASRPSGPPRGD